MEFISFMELLGTVAFAVSGALVAIEKKLDYYGIVFLAIITAVGGGITRDMMINVDLPSSLANPVYVIISVISAAAVICFYKKIIRYSNVMQFFDALGLGAFTALGAEVAVNQDVYMPFVVITLAVLTGTGGGILRDVFTREIPFVFRKEVYAVASVIGALAFLLTFSCFGNMVAVYVSFAVTVVIRLVCMKMNWHVKRVSKED